VRAVADELTRLGRSRDSLKLLHFMKDTSSSPRTALSLARAYDSLHHDQVIIMELPSIHPSMTTATTAYRFKPKNGPPILQSFQLLSMLLQLCC